MQLQNPELWKRGVELLKGSEYARAVYNIPKYKSYLKDSPTKFWGEVMANAIGKRGAVLFNDKSKAGTWDKWMDKVGKWIKNKLNISSNKNYEALTLSDWLDTAVHGTVSGKIPTKQTQKQGVPDEVSFNIAEAPKKGESYYTDKSVEEAMLDGKENEAKWWKPKGWLRNLVPPAADDYYGLIRGIRNIVPEATLEKVGTAFQRVTKHTLKHQLLSVRRWLKYRKL